VNETLNAELAFRLGRAAAEVLTEDTRHKPVIVIGKDTRVSGDMLEAALTEGVTSAGADVLLAGVVPTPAVAYFAKYHADAGVVISASHNPYEYNGIKFFNGCGYKLSDELEDRIESLINQPLKIGGGIGRIRPYVQAAERYIEYLLSSVTFDLSGLRVALDCANGAASATAEALFRYMNPKELFVINDRPDGVNINDRCGSTHMEALRALVTEKHCDVGFAFDGDADRCLCVDADGNIVDGDKIMAVCALHEKEPAFVATVMSDLGLHIWARERGIRLVCAPVGDRYVLEEMLKSGIMLGGEQSGHLIFLWHSTTGDGQLTALKLLSAMAETGESIQSLTSEIPKYPQVLLNIPVRWEDKAKIAEHPAVSAAVAEAEKSLGADGRVLVRPSGTEALVRVMVEGRDAEEIAALAHEIQRAVESA
jgi:phosphoglucosamine mutase